MTTYLIIITVNLFVHLMGHRPTDLPAPTRCIVTLRAKAFKFVEHFKFGILLSFFSS